MPHQTCATCRFYLATDAHAVDDGTPALGECRRYPRTLIDRAGAYVGSYPVETAGDHWCGEWEPQTPDTLPDAAEALAKAVLNGDLTAARALADLVRE